MSTPPPRGTTDPAGEDGGSTLRVVGAALAAAWRAGAALTAGYAFLTLLGAVAPVAAAWLTKAALDALTGAVPATDRLLGLGLGLAGVGALAAVLPHGCRYLAQELERRIAREAQDRLFAVTGGFIGLARFEQPAFLDRLRMAQLAGGSAPATVTGAVLVLARGLLTAGGFIGSLVVLSPWLAATVLLAAGPAVLAELHLARRRAAMLWRITAVERRELFYRELLTSVPAAREIRLFGTGGYLRGRLAEQRWTADAERRGLDRRELTTQAALGVLAAGTAGAGLVWALLAAGQGLLTAGSVALLVASVAGVQGAVVELVGELALAHQQLLLFRHHLAVVESPPDLPVAAAPRRTAPLRRGIEVRDVWFRYSPQHPWALRGVDLTIPHGRTVGLVGRNGAGKSTLVALLCRLYDPDRGAVLWDGVDLRELDPAALRDRIGAVFQDFMCYDLSARENIALGDLTALPAPDRVEAAARRAGVHRRLAALPRGYDTLLSRLFVDGDATGDADGSGGVGSVLSGGEWQRLALARALLADRRDLLILDEPSSGLDAEAEAEVHATLSRHRAGRTSLLISHRLGAVRDADELVVLDAGAVVERGDHAALLRADGVYARLYHHQAAGYRPVPA